MRRASFAVTANLVAPRGHRPVCSIHALVLAAALIGCGGGDEGTTTKNDTSGGTADSAVEVTQVEPDSTTPPDSTVAPDSSDDVDSSIPDGTVTSPDGDTSTSGDDDAVTSGDDDAVTAGDDDAVTSGDDDAVTSSDDDAVSSGDADATTSNDADVVTTPCSGATLEHGCPCTSDNVCASGFCAIGTEGSTCVDSCDADADCPNGTKCVDSGDGNGGVCLQPKDFLCLPCDSDTECRAAGGTGRCLSFGAGGSFCGTTCGGDDQCPDSFYCLQGQCVPDSGSCDCTDVALELGASTTCRFTNSFGVCTGQRTCSPTGITACDARTPARDICDGFDQNCNGVFDDDPTNCEDNNPCTQDTCGGANGCTHTPRTGASCSDNQDCTTNDQCQPDGTCKGTAVGTGTCTCTSANDCLARLGAGLDTECVTATCNGDGTCSYVNHTGACSDDNACTTGDTCNAGKCEATVKDCNDNNSCTNDSCNASTGACVNTARTGACEDGNGCTTNDTCNGGICVGQALDCSSLDDACHVGVCDGAGGCAAQALTCGVSGMRVHVPAAAFSRKGSGATWLEGSVGHGGPIGKSSNNIHTIHFGIHPGNR